MSDDGQRFDCCQNVPFTVSMGLSATDEYQQSHAKIVFQNPELAAYILFNFLSFVFKRKLLFRPGEEEKE